MYMYINVPYCTRICTCTILLLVPLIQNIICTCTVQCRRATRIAKVHILYVCHSTHLQNKTRPTKATKIIYMHVDCSASLVASIKISKAAHNIF